MSELFYMWYITISGVISVISIISLARHNTILASCVGVLVFFLMMLLLFFISLFGRIKRRKDTETDDESRVR